MKLTCRSDEEDGRTSRPGGATVDLGTMAGNDREKDEGDVR